MNLQSILIKPRPWQTAFVEAALTHFGESMPRAKNFLAAVCPGAGKTIGAYLLARKMLERGDIQHVIVVGHTDRIRTQWVDVARQVGLQATTDIPASNNSWPRHAQVLIVTYQQVVNRYKAIAHLATWNTPTLVVFDEIHHAGDENTWGGCIKAAFTNAHRRLSLTGTAFRNDGQPIPYVRYSPRTYRVEPDFSLDYAVALSHGYVSPVFFPTFDIEAKWAKGEEVFEASPGSRLTQMQMVYQLNTAIDSPSFVETIIGKAHERLAGMRETGHGNAAGFVVARDQKHAHWIAKRVEKVTGEAPTLVISDDKDAAAKLDAFRDGDDKWLVAVRMVTEGVDIPRLRVGVYATNVRSDLFFWQWVGRISRVVSGLDDQSSYAFIPADPDLLEFAREIYEQRLHVLPPKQKVVRADPQRGNGQPGPQFEALSATAQEGLVIAAGQEYPLALMQWAARERMAKGFWNVTEIDFIRMACHLWGVTVPELMVQLGIVEQDELPQL